MALIEKVSIYLQRESIRPMVYGENDCCLFPANLAKELTGKDPAEPFRGKYDDEVGATRFCSEAGGLPILINRAFLRAGFELIEQSQDGDCGCVHYTGESVGAIFFQERWWMKRPDGVVIVPPEELRVLKVWNVSGVVG